MADDATSIGPYRVGAPLGSGGFAAVYRARDERLDAEVAIKVLGDNHSLDPDLRERFLTEAQLLRRVDSEHVIRVHDVGETDRHQPYLVLELAAGGSLRDRARARRRADAAWAPTSTDLVAVADALAAALSALHTARIVHRDVSPGNLLVRGTRRGDDAPLVGDGERLVLADLGYAKDLAASSGLTVGGGTAGFQAPEQRATGRVDARADVYAASAVLAWLASGTEPGPDGYAGVPAGVPSSLAPVLRRGLAADPHARIADIGAWRDAVRGALAPSPPAGATTGAPAPRRRGVVAVIAALVVGALVAAGATALVLRGGGDGAGPRVVVTEQGDGTVRSAVADGDVVAAIFGPVTLRVGEPVTFTAGVRGARSFAWVTPDGTLVPGAETVRVTASSAGPFRLRLVATAPDGRTVVVTHAAEAS